MDLLTIFFGQQLTVFEPLQSDALLALFGEGMGVTVTQAAVGRIVRLRLGKATFGSSKPLQTIPQAVLRPLML